MEFINFENNGLTPLSLKNILLRVDELTLWRYYLNNSTIRINVNIKAPYRADNTPSFSIYVNDLGRIIGKDFRGDFQGDVFQYIQYTSPVKLSFYESLHKVNIDFNLNLAPKKLYTNYKNTISNLPLANFNNNLNITHTQTKEEEVIEFTIREFNEKDIYFFKNQGISKKTLERYNVFCVKKAFLNNKLYYTYICENDPCYAFYFPKTGKVKLYFPYREKNRFLSNCNNEKELQGFLQLKKERTDILFITKSYKDVMLFDELNINAVAPHGESHFLPKKALEFLIRTHKITILLYDNDIAGIKASRKIFKENGFPPYVIPKVFTFNGNRIKDLTELYEHYGLITTHNFINHITNIEKKYIEKHGRKYKY